MAEYLISQGKYVLSFSEMTINPDFTITAESASSQEFIAQTARTVVGAVSGTVESSVLVPSKTSSVFQDTQDSSCAG